MGKQTVFCGFIVCCPEQRRYNWRRVPAYISLLVYTTRERQKDAVLDERLLFDVIEQAHPSTNAKKIS
jgi:hypothetical protein